MAWVANRVSNLERYLPTLPTLPTLPMAAEAESKVKASELSPRHPTETKSPSTALEDRAVTSLSTDCRHMFGDEIIVQKGSQSQYFNEVFLSRVIEEQRDIQSALATPRSEWQTLVEGSIYNPMGILSGKSNTQVSSRFFPSSQTGLRLWNLYLERIDSCTGLKVLHVPTDEVKVCATIDNPAGAQSENLALCFAIFYATIAAVEPAEAQAVLGDVITSQSRFKIGFEQALADAEILDNPTLTLLSALSIFLSALRIHNRGKGIWILNGLAIRIAQAMGLHRNGERLGLSPFESELRRRLWWHFLDRDSRAGEDYGLQKLCNLRSDADLPLNVDDSDLYLEMKALPPPRSGLTAMTLPLVSYHIARAVHRLAGIVATSSLLSPPQESVRAQIMTETKDHIKEWLQEYNPVIPRHRLALLVSRLAVRKANLVSRQQWLTLRLPKPCEALATEENLVEALELLEMVLQLWKDEMLRPYSWSWRANPEYHVTMYLLWHLCVRPDGPNVDRAWSAISLLFEMDGQFGDSWGSKGAMLHALKGKAEMIRAERRTRIGIVDETSKQEARHTAATVQQQGEAAAPWAAVQKPGRYEGNDWPREPEEVLNWESFIESLGLEGQNLDTLWQYQ